MDCLSFTRYAIVIAYLCNSIVSDSISVSNTSSDQWTLAISVSTRTMSDVSTRLTTLGERREHTREYSITDAVSDSDTTDSAPTIDPGCRDGNATHLCMNTSAGPGILHEVSFAVDIINRIQLAITCVGFFANAATYLTLTFNGGRFSPLILLLIKHQSLLDMVACGMMSLSLFLPTGNWLTGSRTVDVVICYIWHSQMLIWTCVCISAWNLVLIGVERYIMICKPFVYLSVTRKHFIYSFAVLYVGCLVCLFPFYLHMSFVDGECSNQVHSEGFWRRFYYGYGYFITFAVYILPVEAFTFIYGYVA